MSINRKRTWEHSSSASRTSTEKSSLSKECQATVSSEEVSRRENDWVLRWMMSLLSPQFSNYHFVFCDCEMFQTHGTWWQKLPIGGTRLRCIDVNDRLIIESDADYLVSTCVHALLSSLASNKVGWSNSGSSSSSRTTTTRRKLYWSGRLCGKNGEVATRSVRSPRTRLAPVTWKVDCQYILRCMAPHSTGQSSREVRGNFRPAQHWRNKNFRTVVHLQMDRISTSELFLWEGAECNSITGWDRKYRLNLYIPPALPRPMSYFHIFLNIWSRGMYFAMNTPMMNNLLLNNICEQCWQSDGQTTSTLIIAGSKYRKQEYASLCFVLRGKRKTN